MPVQHGYKKVLEGDQCLTTLLSLRNVPACMGDSVRLGEGLRLAALVAFAAVAAVGLHRVGGQPHLQVDWADVSGWMGTRPAEDVVAAAARLAGLALAYWVLATSSLYVLARLSRVPAAVRAVRWAALPPVRRLADRAVAATLTSSALLAGPAAAAATAQPPAVVEEEGGSTEAGIAGQPTDGYAPTPAGGEPVTPGLGPPGGPPLPAAPQPVRPQPRAEPAGEDATVDVTAADGGDQAAGVSADSPPADPARPTVDRPAGDTPTEPTVGEQHYTVVAGDHLWGIAERTLTAAWGRPPSTGELDGYWRRLVASNAMTVASGDPDLIYPGEVLTLPAVPDSEE